jgi:DNA-directed RNA polymerase specialized sigma24 family protein
VHLSNNLLRTPGHPGRRLATMDRAEAVRLLPEAYARALTLRDQGQDDTRIAAALGIVPEAIGPLLRLAEAKLQRLLDDPPEVDDRLAVPLEQQPEPPEAAGV